jgi:hypothetical protein
MTHAHGWVWMVSVLLVGSLMLGGCSDANAAAEMAEEIGVGGGPVACFGTVHDLTIDSSDPSAGDVLGPVCWVDGSPEMSCLLRWDVSAIPSNATVTGAELTVSVVDASLASYSGQRVIRPWSEAAASWLNAKIATTWATAGAKAATDRSPSTLFTFSGNQGIQHASLNSAGVAAVQAWVNSSANNQGVIISSTDTHRMGISSKEGAEAPLLCVGYTTP